MLKRSNFARRQTSDDGPLKDLNLTQQPPDNCRVEGQDESQPIGDKNEIVYQRGMHSLKKDKQFINRFQ